MKKKAYNTGYNLVQADKILENQKKYKLPIITKTEQERLKNKHLNNYQPLENKTVEQKLLNLKNTIIIIHQQEPTNQNITILHQYITRLEPLYDLIQQKHQELPRILEILSPITTSLVNNYSTLNQTKNETEEEIQGLLENPEHDDT